MSIAWATVAIILLLLPGVFFFIGLASYERLSREIIRSSVVSEIALAAAIAGAIHFVALCSLGAFGFRLSRFIAPVVLSAEKLSSDLVPQIAERLVPTALYLATTTTIGFGLGFFVAIGVVAGPLRRLARHKWIYDLVDADRKSKIVTAYVMTTIVEASKIIMYKGRVHDIFLQADGNISYIVLRNSFRYYMAFEGGNLITSKQLELFGARQSRRPEHVWDRLLIEGKNIANVLFDSSPEITRQAEGEEALQRALEETRQRTAIMRQRIVAEMNRRRQEAQLRSAQEAP